MFNLQLATLEITHLKMIEYCHLENSYKNKLLSICGITLKPAHLYYL